MTAAIATKRRTQPDYAGLAKQGLTLEQIAEATKRTTRSVQRGLEKEGIVIWSRRDLVTDEMVTRVQCLAEEGMPVTWACEGTGHVPGEFRERGVKMSDPQEWRSVWQSIRQSTVLLELHYQFAPHNAKEGRSR